MGRHQAGSEGTTSLAAQRPMRASRFGGFHIALLLAWFLASFGLVFFAEDLQFTVAGWPLGYWLAAQGSVL
ncbi:MAG: DUF4212 domain-containing protein, partial [Rhodoferax sp.]|nr:DUF4212 domain-containing protein [Rhodoferax sp.]